jgi:hypothetical protein
MRSLVCFGDQPVVLVAYWPTAQEAGTDVPCPWTGPRWILCYEYVNRTGDGTRTLPIYGTTDLTHPLRGQWVTCRMATSRESAMARAKVAVKWW